MVDNRREAPDAGDTPAAVSPSSRPEADRALEPRADEVGLLELVNVLLRRWRLVVGVPLGAVLLVAVLSLVIPPIYRATVSFVPESRSQARLPAGLSGLAGQLGISLDGDASRSPRFYKEVVTSREIVERVLLDRYPDPRSHGTPADSTTLLEILKVSGSGFAARLDKGTRRLRKLVSTRVDDQTSIVEVRVDARYPELAAEVANRFIYYLNEFNAKTRQSQARERRRFAEERVASAEQELRRAEGELRDFYQRNRSWQQSAELVFEEGRLRRQVAVAQEVYLTLRREYETARIEEVNDVPVITVIDPAVPPQRRSGPSRLLLLALAVLLGGVVAVFGALGGEYVQRMERTDGGEYREFHRLVRALAADIRDTFAKRRPRGQKS